MCTKPITEFSSEGNSSKVPTAPTGLRDAASRIACGIPNLKELCSRTIGTFPPLFGRIVPTVQIGTLGAVGTLELWRIVPTVQIVTLGAVGTLELWWYRADSSESDTKHSWNPGTVVVSCRQFRRTLGAVGTLERLPCENNSNRIQKLNIEDKMKDIIFDNDNLPLSLPPSNFHATEKFRMQNNVSSEKH
jgi:hypothetical protein